MNLICDLDGVLYRGGQAIEGSGAALRTAAGAGLDIWFVTNNSTRSPHDVRQKIEQITGYSTSEQKIVTSAQAAASMMAPDSGPAYVLGSVAIEEALADVGIASTRDPATATAVVVGMDHELTYERLSGAVAAVRRGARFIATNDDPTYPVEDGFEPGSGAMVAAVEVASGRRPEIAGKPHPPMRDLLVARGVGRAWVIGDRLDTDIALAGSSPDWTSIVVLTGVTTEEDDHSAADHVAADLGEAINLVLEDRSRQ